MNPMSPGGAEGMKSPLVLQVEDLRVEFQTYDAVAQVLNRVNLQIQRGDILALLGESGCGKSTAALTIAGLIRQPPARIVSGRALFQGQDLLPLPENERRQLRARKIGMIFQDPSSNLNPLLTIGQQLTDAILCRLGQGSTLGLSPLGNLAPGTRRARQQARERGVHFLTRVGIPDARERLDAYPDEFSGGMK